MRVSTRGAVKVRRTVSAHGQASLSLSGGHMTEKARDVAQSGLFSEKSLSGFYAGVHNAD